MAVRDVERLDDAISWLAARASRLGGAPMRPAVRCACRAASPRRDIFGVSSTVAGRICSQLMMIRNRPSLGAVRALRAFTVGRPRRARGHWEVFRPPVGVEEGCGYASSRVGHRGDGPAARAHRGRRRRHADARLRPAVADIGVVAADSAAALLGGEVGVAKGVVLEVHNGSDALGREHIVHAFRHRRPARGSARLSEEVDGDLRRRRECE